MKVGEEADNQRLVKGQGKYHRHFNGVSLGVRM